MVIMKDESLISFSKHRTILKKCIILELKAYSCQALDKVLIFGFLQMLMCVMA